MANINLQWYKEISERLNVGIDLDSKKATIYCLNSNSQCSNTNDIIT